MRKVALEIVTVHARKGSDRPSGSNPGGRLLKRKSCMSPGFLRNGCIFVGILSFAALGCSSGPQTVVLPSVQRAANSVSDGTSIESAVVIGRRQGETGSVESEYAWLATHFKQFKIREQALQLASDRYFDVIEIELENGSIRQVYFDITNSFGNFDR